MIVQKKIDLCLVGLVHGDEKNALNIFRCFLEDIKKVQLKQKIMIVLANLEAAKKNVRFIERDLNRSFGITSNHCLEEKIAKKIIDKIKRAKYLIDFHQTSQKTKFPFFIFSYSKKRLEFAESIASGFPIITYKKKFSSDGDTLDDYAEKLGVIGVTVEMGKQGYSKKQTTQGVGVIKMALSHGFKKKKEKIKSEIYTFGYTFDKKNYPDLKLDRGFYNLKEIKKGERVGATKKSIIKAPISGKILFPKYGKHYQASNEICHIIVKTSDFT